MKRALLFISLFCLPFSGCFEDTGGIDINRDLNPLEEKLIGTWGWAAYGRNDTLTFNRNFTYSGKKDGYKYSGSYNLTLDSTLTMIGTTNMYGVLSTDDMRFTMHQLSTSILILSAASREQITYRKAAN